VRIVSTDPEQPGVFAIGQEARGIFALGQMATGVVAVGQLARGVIVVGQLAIGVVAVGQGAVALGWGGGMIGVVGRGFGIVLKLAPRYRADRGRPKFPGEGWLDARVLRHGLVDGDGKPLDIEMTPEVAATLARTNDSPAFVHVAAEERPEREGGYREPAETRRVLRAVAVTPWTPWPWPFEALSDGEPAPVWQLVLRAIALAGLAAVWWFVVGQSLIAMFE
jgi:hypothetical protein